MCIFSCRDLNLSVFLSKNHNFNPNTYISQYYSHILKFHTYIRIYTYLRAFPWTLNTILLAHSSLQCQHHRIILFKLLEVYCIFWYWLEQVHRKKNCIFLFFFLFLLPFFNPTAVSLVCCGSTDLHLSWGSSRFLSLHSYALQPFSSFEAGPHLAGTVLSLRIRRIYLLMIIF